MDSILLFLIAEVREKIHREVREAYRKIPQSQAKRPQLANSSELKVDRIQRNSLPRQQDAVAQQRRMVAEGLLGAQPGKLRRIIRLGQMPQDNP
jgi:hypothetical protein